MIDALAPKESIAAMAMPSIRVFIILDLRFPHICFTTYTQVKYINFRSYNDIVYCYFFSNMIYAISFKVKKIGCHVDMTPCFCET